MRGKRVVSTVDRKLYLDMSHYEQSLHDPRLILVMTE